jgi:Na+-transporting NADH:ubiquinone oxidoreductase subunit NqrF
MGITDFATGTFKDGGGAAEEIHYWYSCRQRAENEYNMRFAKYKQDLSTFVNQQAECKRQYEARVIEATGVIFPSESFDNLVNQVNGFLKQLI